MKTQSQTISVGLSFNSTQFSLSSVFEYRLYCNHVALEYILIILYNTFNKNVHNADANIA